MYNREENNQDPGLEQNEEVKPSNDVKDMLFPDPDKVKARNSYLEKVKSSFNVNGIIKQVN